MDDNVFEFVKGGKDAAADKLPENSYVITTMDNEEFYGTGFVIFTTHHVAVMQEIGEKGAVPVLVIPLVNVKACEMVDPNLDLPF